MMNMTGSAECEDMGFKNYLYICMCSFHTMGYVNNKFGSSCNLCVGPWWGSDGLRPHPRCRLSSPACIIFQRWFGASGQRGSCCSIGCLQRGWQAVAGTYYMFNLSSSILSHGSACESASEILGNRCFQLSRRISRPSRSFLLSSSAWVSRLTMLWYNRTQQCDHLTNQICIIAQTK